jgi:hypothetical protein
MRRLKSALTSALNIDAMIVFSNHEKLVRTHELPTTACALRASENRRADLQGDPVIRASPRAVFYSSLIGESILSRCITRHRQRSLRNAAAAGWAWSTRLKIPDYISYVFPFI